MICRKITKQRKKKKFNEKKVMRIKIGKHRKKNMFETQHVNLQLDKLKSSRTARWRRWQRRELDARRSDRQETERKKSKEEEKK